MQCGRDRLPGLQAPVPLADWLAKRTPAAPGLVLAPSAALRLGEWVPAAAARGAPVELDLLVGPESGLTDAELDAASAAGLVPVSLGPRILRTETAGLAAIAALQARLGDL
jgi:16S rRNA (uracil1498-N3)-methyltransferase